MKPGYKTTEFYLTLVTILVGTALSTGFIPVGLPGTIAGTILTVLAALGYTYYRGELKKVQPILRLGDTKSGYKTTEFWLSLFVIILNTCITTGLVRLDSSIDETIGLTGLVTLILGYIQSRSGVKQAVSTTER